MKSAYLVLSVGIFSLPPTFSLDCCFINYNIYFLIESHECPDIYFGFGHCILISPDTLFQLAFSLPESLGSLSFLFVDILFCLLTLSLCSYIVCKISNQRQSIKMFSLTLGLLTCPRSEKSSWIAVILNILIFALISMLVLPRLHILIFSLENLIPMSMDPLVNESNGTFSVSLFFSWAFYET